jgi:Bacterial Ig-like domain
VSGAHRLSIVVAVLVACARVQAPPGGPTDKAPPRLTSTHPDSLAVLPGFDDDVEFRFDEVISEGSSPNFGTGTGDLEKLILLSPSAEVPSVHWKRSRIRVRPKEGWRPNRVYRVELLPGVADLASNRSKNGRVITFTTGAPLPTATLRGRLVDWTTRRPATVGRGVIEAILLPDSLGYRTSIDSTGRFVLDPIPPGEYLVYGVLDQNGDNRRQPREAFDSVRVERGRDSVGEIWAFRHDTTGIRAFTAAPNDSISLVLTFPQPVNPYQRLPPDSLEVRILPDSTRVPVLRLLTGEEYDTTYPKAVVDSATRAKADSARRADSVKADSLRRAREAAAIRIPGAERRREAAPDTTGTGPLRTKPTLFDKLYVRMAEPLRRGGRYLILLHGIQNLSRIPGTPKSVLAIPTDTARAKPDTAKAKPDTAKVKPDTSRSPLTTQHSP